MSHEGTSPSSSAREGLDGDDQGHAQLRMDKPWRAAMEEAKVEARRQLRQMLSRPEDLARLAELREEVAVKLHRAETELATRLEVAVDDVRFGIEALHTARQAAVDTRENFAKIDALCEEESSGLADHQDIIRNLAVMRVNLSKTLSDAEAILALPGHAAEAMELLSDDRNLFACWERLTELERRALPARMALEAARRQPQGGVSRSTSRPTAAHFICIDDAMTKFETTLWHSVRSSVFAGRGGCKALVRALRVVEAQESLDELLAASARDQASRFFSDQSTNHVPSKQYKQRVLRELRDSVAERFEMTVDALVPEVVDGDSSSTSVSVPLVLENLDILMQQLTEAYDYAVPAFPPEFRVFEAVLAPAWHRRVSSFLSNLVHISRDLSNADIIAVLQWYRTYTEQMDALGVDVESVPSEPSASSEAAATPPPPTRMIPQTILQTGGPPTTRKAALRQGEVATSSGAPKSGDESRDVSTISLESFLATGKNRMQDSDDFHSVTEKLDAGRATSSGISTPLRNSTRGESNEIPADVIGSESDDDDGCMRYPIGLVKLVDVYASRMSKTVQTWSSNLQKMTATQPLSEAEDGTLWTASDVEFFRLLNEQLEVALGGGQQLISAAAAVISSSLLDFASQQHRRLGGEAIATASTAPAGLSALSSPTHFRRPSIIAGGLLEKAAEDRVAVAAAKAVDYNVLLAGVNDGTRCHNLASEIEVLLSDALGPEGAIHGYSGEPDTDGETKREASKSFLHSALEAFKRNADHSATAAAAAVTSDPSVVSLFGKLFVVDKVGGGPWLEGEVSETLVATIADYLGDVEQFVTRDLRPMVAEAVLSRVVKITMEVCMRQLQCIRPGTVERMDADEAALRECFAGHLQHKTLEPWLQRLAEVRDMAAADDAEAFVLAYGLLVRSAPELGLEPAERLLAAREDIPRATQKEMLEECRELLGAARTSPN